MKKKTLSTNSFFSVNSKTPSPKKLLLNKEPFYIAKIQQVKNPFHVNLTKQSNKTTLKHYDCWEIILAIFASHYSNNVVKLLNVGHISSISHYLNDRKLQREQIIAIYIMAGVSLEKAPELYDHLVQTNQWPKGSAHRSLESLYKNYCATLKGQYQTEPEMLKQLYILAAICRSETIEEAANLLDKSKGQLLEDLLLMELDYSTIQKRFSKYKKQSTIIELTASTSLTNNGGQTIFASNSNSCNNNQALTDTAVSLCGLNSSTNPSS